MDTAKGPAQKAPLGLQEAAKTVQVQSLGDNFNSIGRKMGEKICTQLGPGGVGWNRGDNVRLKPGAAVPDWEGHGTLVPGNGAKEHAPTVPCCEGGRPGDTGQAIGVHQ
jgi:hypothetical protein